jgi:DNA-binding NtrC family response regulator
MKAILELADRVASSLAPVLITGEHGTGKEVIARWIHLRSDRSAGPVVTVNAGGLPEGVLESELFGHIRGAFTDARADRAGCFELADGGTLFLDEIANMPLSQQAKLLRVLETGEIQRLGSSKVRFCDVRILAATNADLRREIEAGRFREDLLYRLNAVVVRVPPLRERREDIVTLAEGFLHEFAERYRKGALSFHPLARQAYLAHPWPGNVRELEHAVERGVLLSRGEEVTVADLGLGETKDGSPHLEEMTLEDAERHLILKALERAGGNANQAAETLGLSRSALYRRLQRYGIGGIGTAE